MAKSENSRKCPECAAPLSGSNGLESHWEQHHLRATTRLRRFVEGEGMVVAPFCLDAFHAKIAESVGFQAVYMTGFGSAAERGYPDVGLITQTEMAQNARYVVDAVDVPVICDADTGYGNPINVWRTVRDYEAIGAAGVHIEDQVFPKKCGFFEGKDVVPVEEHVQKIRAALDARRDKDFLIIARCDALAVNGWPDAMMRCRTYRDAGADVVFLDGVHTVEELKSYAADLSDVPRLYNGMLLPTQDVESLGFKIMITGGTIQVVYNAVKTAFEQLRDDGIVPVDVAPTRVEIGKLLGLDWTYEMERRYATVARD